MLDSSLAPHATPVAHTPFDDVQAGATAVVLVSLGLSLIGSAGLVTGGTPGLGFLLSAVSGLPLGGAIFLVSLPFYVLGWRGLGLRFTLKTLAAVTSLSVCIEVVRHVLAVQAAPAYAAVVGGVLIGTGLLVLFRHQASFGGVNILALFLQKRFGWPTGRTQMGVDLLVLGASFAIMEPGKVAWSLLGAAAVNAVLVWNHRPGRYLPAA
jgi:uncharacterized membrane-anchored protein YitT (DUF2179 family)